MCAKERKGTSIQSVDRAISILELLSVRGWSGVTEIARKSGIHKSTAYRLLVTLRDRGLVEQDAGTEKYRLGFGMVLLASAVTADIDIVRHARPVCELLSEQTRETVNVTVLEGDEAVIIHQTISTASALSVDWSGRHTPLHATAAGKVFLFHMPEDQRRRILGRLLERFTEDTMVDPASFREELRRIGEEGYAYTAGELEVGLNAVAAPVYRTDGAVVAALSVSGPAFRLSMEAIPEVARLTKEGAKEVSRLLGFSG